MKKEETEHQEERVNATEQPWIDRIDAYMTGPIPGQSLIKCNESYEGESIERRVEKIMANKEPITDGAPMIYTEREAGVIPEYNVRTDRFDVALDMTDQITKNKLNERQTRRDQKQEQGKPATEKPNTTDPAPTKTETKKE